MTLHLGLTEVSNGNRPFCHGNVPTWLFAFFLLVFTSCDSVPGVTDPTASSPVVSGIQVSPEVLALDQLGGEGETVSAQITVTADVTDADNDLTAAFVLIRSSSPGQAPLAQEEVQLGNAGTFTSRLDLTVPRASGGQFVVSVFAADAAGNISNTAYGSIQVSGESAPPEIMSIDMPDQVTRPAAGLPPISISIQATVSDPDGLDNVAFVEVIVNGAATLRLCDDGGSGTCNNGFGSSGDLDAGDGVYTLTIQLDASNSAGTNSFEFTAVDRTGLRSGTVSRTIVVQ